MQGDGESDSTQIASKEATINYAAKKYRIVKLLLAYSAILGVMHGLIQGFSGEQSTPQLDFILSVPLLVLGISWSFTDASERGHRIGRVVRLLLIFLFVVGFAIYLFQTRGAGAFKSLAMTVVLFVVINALMSAAMYATLYAGDFAGLWQVVD